MALLVADTCVKISTHATPYVHAASLTTDVAEQVNVARLMLLFNLSAGDATLSAGGFVHVRAGSSLAMREDGR